MSNPLVPATKARFGPYEVDFRAGELRKNGRRIRLQDQPLQILAMLLEQPGGVVTREELRQRLWRTDTFVDFDHGLNNAINRLREALNDSADAPKFIETLPRRGYRFVAEVNGPASAVAWATGPTDSIESGEIARVAGPEETATAKPSRAPLLLPVGKFWLFAASVGIAALLILWLYVSRQRPMATKAAERIQSIAVLPLENLSGDPSQEYFADGMTDALITDLAQVSALRVISRTSTMQYKGKGALKPLPVIARELGVDAVVEGTVARSGDRVRIDAQLIEAKSDRHLWANEYEGNLGDILALQGKVAKAITQEIRAQLTRNEEERLAASRPTAPEVYELYLKGQFYLSKRTEADMRKSLDYFQKAVQTDPNWPLPYAGMADAYDLLASLAYEPVDAIPKAKAAARKALELDPSLAEAQTTLASVADLDWNFAEAERLYKEAIAQKPGYATAHHWYARHLATLGQYKEALTEINKARDLDPLSLIITVNVGEIHSWYGEYDQAIQEYQKALELDANFARAHGALGAAYEQKRMFPEAVSEYVKAGTLAGSDPANMAALQDAYSAGGWRAYSLKRLELLERLSGRRYVSPYLIARACARTGDADQAFARLEKAFTEHSGWMVQLKVDPAFSPIRSDPRFQDLLRRVGFPQ